MTIHLRRSSIAVVTTVIAAVSYLSACSSDPSSENTNTPSTPAPTSVSSAPGDTNGDVQQRRAGREPQTLGNLQPKPKTGTELGAPFEPCGLSWNDFPEQVRPKDNQPHAPTPQEIGRDVQWDVECDYDNSGPTDVTVQPGGGPPKVQDGAVFKVIIAWAKSGTADPAKNPGSQPKEWSGRPGFLKPAPPHPTLGEGCTAAIRLRAVTGAAGGSALVFVSDARFPMPACDVADKLAAVIATKNQ
jgi:hypothetical protein